MLMMAQPIYDCFCDVTKDFSSKPHVVYMSPQGKVLTQKKAVELSKLDNLVILCGHYEGVDERVLEAIVDEQISIGDYVLTGGEIPAMALIDCVSRMIPGVLADEVCFTDESHLIRAFRKQTGSTPSAIRKKDKDKLWHVWSFLL